jgi:hypothetical protein
MRRRSSRATNLPTKEATYDEIADVFPVSPLRPGILDFLMFATKPATASLEFDELARAFDRGALATLFGRNPDTVSRWRRERRVPHTLEATVDRFWWVMHVACAERQWPVDAARYFLLSIEPELGRRPAELVRASDEQARSVVQVIARRSAPVGDPVQPSGAPPEDAMTVPNSPFAQLLADEPDDDDLLAREYRTPSLVGRARAIGGVQEDLDPFRVHYTAKTSHAIPLGASAVGV